MNESVRLQERLKHRFFAHRAPSNSLVPAPANNKQIGRTPEGKVGGKDEERGKDVDLPNVSLYLNTMCEHQARHHRTER